jgi:tetratricopeptide (TPR) repeat protein
MNQIMRMLTREQIVVSASVGTELYIVFEKVRWQSRVQFEQDESSPTQRGTLTAPQTFINGPAYLEALTLANQALAEVPSPSLMPLLPDPQFWASVYEDLGQCDNAIADSKRALSLDYSFIHPFASIQQITIESH